VKHPKTPQRKGVLVGDWGLSVNPGRKNRKELYSGSRDMTLKVKMGGANRMQCWLEKNTYSRKVEENSHEREGKRDTHARNPKSEEIVGSVEEEGHSPANSKGEKYKGGAKIQGKIEKDEGSAEKERNKGSAEMA